MVTFPAAAADEGSVWWLWVLGGLAVWSVVALLFAVVLGRGIRLADRRSLGVGLDDLLTCRRRCSRPRRPRPRGSVVASPCPRSGSCCSPSPLLSRRWA